MCNCSVTVLHLPDWNIFGQSTPEIWTGGLRAFEKRQLGRKGGCRPSSRFWEPAEDASGTRSWVSGMKGAGLRLVILVKSVPFCGSHFPHLRCRVASGVHFPNWAQENTGNISRCGFPMAVFGQGYFLFWSPLSALAHWSFEKSCSEGTVLVCLKRHVPNSHTTQKAFFHGMIISAPQMSQQ